MNVVEHTGQNLKPLVPNEFLISSEPERFFCHVINNSSASGKLVMK